MNKLKIRLLLIISVLILSTITTIAQILQPVKWDFELVKSGENEVIFKAIARIDANWHVYALDIPEGGPIPTSIRFAESADYELVGDMKTPEAIEKYDSAFEMMMRYYSDNAVFEQRIRLKKTENITISGDLEFMACDDSRCLPPETVEFSLPLTGSGSTQTQPGQTGTAVQEETQGGLTQIGVGSATEQIIQESQAPGEINEVLTEAPAEDTPAKEESSLLVFFFLAMGVGFIGLLTPCVYPMIPMTISFFMNATENKVKAKSQALFFGLSIIFIYTVLGVLVSLIFGAEAIKAVSNHWLTNLIFFLLFAIFSASFFGMFEIVLPSWLTNKSDQQVEKGGYVGSFFMAMTLVLVSFSCTAPFVGGILVEAATGEFLKPTVGMFGFSLAFAIVFTLLAMFPSLLGNMPKSGGWLNSVKVVLAFLILAIGMKYLLVPNVALGWNISREVYIGIWIVLFTLLGFYLLGKIRFSHDSPVDHVSVPRLVLAIAAFSFVFYLVPGLFGAPLKAVSGYLPAESAWDLDEIIKESTRNIKVVGTSEIIDGNICEEPKYADIFHLPHGLKGYFDLEQGLACAKQLNKPIFLDIKGHACTNCKVMEKNVWSDPEVLKRLNEDFVIVALYVDDRTELPESEWITSSFDGKVKKTIGAKNTTYQITTFGVNAQPFYAILGTDGNAISDPIAFEPDVDAYVEFLEKGKAAFGK